MIDLLTTNTEIMVQRRPVVGLSSWLAEAFRLAGGSDRRVQLVTDPASRLTVPVRLALEQSGCRWVVDHEDGPYDALSGRTQTWNGTSFVNGDRTAQPYKTKPPGQVGRQLTLAFRVRHPAKETTMIGDAVERAYEALTGEPPAGWGSSEPAARRWKRVEVTDLCRERAPDPTFFVHVGAAGGRAAIGTTTVSRVPSGVDEATTVVIGYHADEKLPDLTALLEQVAAGTGLMQLLATMAPGRTDLTTIPHFLGPGWPVGLAVGPSASPSPRTATTVDGIDPMRLGVRLAFTIWYPIPVEDEPARAWARLGAVMRHLIG